MFIYYITVIKQGTLLMFIHYITVIKQGSILMFIYYDYTLKNPINIRQYLNLLLLDNKIVEKSLSAVVRL